MIRKMQKWFPISAMLAISIIIAVVTKEINTPYVFMIDITATVFIAIELLNICEKYKFSLYLINIWFIGLCICLFYATTKLDLLVFLACSTICFKVTEIERKYINEAAEREKGGNDHEYYSR